MSGAAAKGGARGGCMFCGRGTNWNEIAKMHADVGMKPEPMAIIPYKGDKKEKEKMLADKRKNAGFQISKK